MYSSSPGAPVAFLVAVLVDSGSDLGSDGSSGSSVVGVFGGAFGVVSIPAFSIAVCSSSILNLALKSASDKIYEGIDLKTALLYLLKISV